MQGASIAVYALSPSGADLARRLAAGLSGRVHLPSRLAGPGEAGFDSLLSQVSREFHAFGAHVFVCAAGIAVRAVAAHLSGKQDDPAVLAVDQAGRFVVSLLGGHMAGANRLARRAAELIGAQAVVTTATDAAGVPAVDELALGSGLSLEGVEAVARISGALLDGGRVAVCDPSGRLDLSGVAEPGRFFEFVSESEALSRELAVVVSWRDVAPARGRLVLRPRVVMCGVGCRRGVGAGEIEAHVRGVCAASGASPAALGALGTIEAKRDEAGLAEAARRLGVRIEYFTSGELGAVSVPNPSQTVREKMGVESVCEAAAMLLAGKDELLCPKTTSARVSAALCVAD